MHKIKEGDFIYLDEAKRMGKCGYHVFLSEIGESKFVVVFTELNDNPGRSVTNAIESIIPQFCRFTALKLEDVWFIERYESHPDDLDVINYNPYGSTSWRRLSQDQAYPILAHL
jgi:replication-associated recombination protein RarA